METSSSKFPAAFSFKLLTFCVLVLTLLCHHGQADEEYTAPARRTKRDAAVPPGTTLRVSVILVEPYVMPANETHFDNFMKYRGFIPDILYELEKTTGLKFELYPVPDGKYGSKTADGNWTGLIGEVIKRENGNTSAADLAAAPLTITPAREVVVDFIKPFQHVGLSMLIKRPVEKEQGEWHHTFTVLKPLSAEVWIACTAAVFVVALILWGNNRINPYEWGGRLNLGRASESAAEYFNLSGSAWFTFTTLQWQGFEKAPRSLSSRVLTIFWFCFVTLTLLTYTGALINHLFWASTVHGKNNLEVPIKDLPSLVRNDKFDYGYIKGGSTERYFMKAAGGPIFLKMRQYWKSDRGQKALVDSLQTGIEKVKQGNYVFFSELSFAKYLMGRDCDLMITGPLLAPRAFGMAVPQNMERSISEALHRGILELMEEGDLEALENKWWLEESKCWMEKKPDPTELLSALYVSDPAAVSLDMFIGPLLLILIGIVLAMAISIGEIIYYKHKGRYKRSNRPSGPQLQLDEEGN